MKKIMILISLFLLVIIFMGCDSKTGEAIGPWCMQISAVTSETIQGEGESTKHMTAAHDAAASDCGKKYQTAYDAQQKKHYEAKKQCEKENYCYVSTNKLNNELCKPQFCYHYFIEDGEKKIQIWKWDTTWYEKSGEPKKSYVSYTVDTWKCFARGEIESSLQCWSELH